MSGEKAVRDYLNYLADPTLMRDDAEVARLEAEADAASDPIDKLRLLSAAQRAKAVDGAHYEASFIAEARSWANAEGVTPEAFRAMGVSADVLGAAGLVEKPKSTARSSAAPRRRAPSVSVEAVRASVPQSPFRVRDLMLASGASIQTTRKVVRALLSEGKLRSLGLDPNWDGRGRTPTLYGPAEPSA